MVDKKKSENIELTIIIPVYNTTIEQVKRCLNSIINLKNIDYEIIFIDDGSKEEYSEKYLEFLEKKSKVRYKKITNKGVSSARNIGMDMALGNYIMFVDSDDMIFSEKILKEYFKIEADVMFFNKVFLVNEKKYERKEIEESSGFIDSKNILKEYILDRCFHEPFAKLYKKEFLDKNNIRFNEKIIHGEDAIFNLDILLLNPKTYYIDETLYGYYYDIKTSKNRWKNNPKKMFENYIYLKERKKEVLNNIKFDNKKEYELIFENQLVNSAFQSCMTLAEYKNKNILILFSKYFNEIHLSSNDKKIKLEYWLITNQKWKIIGYLNELRKIYLKYLKKKY